MKKSILLLSFIIVVLTACSKSSSESIKGLYSGTFTYNGSVGGTATTDVTVRDNNSVDMDFVFNSSSSAGLNDITVIDEGNGLFSLNYADATGTLTGEVENTNLTWTLVAASDNDTTEFVGSLQ